MSSRGTGAALAVVTCLFFAWGFITSNNDPLIAALRGIHTLSVTEGMLTQFAFFLAYVVMSLPAAMLLARLGHSRTIIAALALMIAACLIVLAASHMGTYAMVLAALFVMANGITALQVAANPLAAALGAPERSHLRLTFAQAFNALGVVAGVNIGSRLMLREEVFGENGHIRPGIARANALDAVDHAFVLISIFVAALAILIFCYRKRIDAAAGRTRAANASPLAAFSSGWALAGAATMFLYVGAEVTIGSVMINFLNRPDVLGVSLRTAGDFYLTWLYWGGALVGRFIGSALLSRVKAGHLLAIVATIAACLSTAASVLHGPPAAYAALAVGLFNAIMFPTIFSLTLQRARAPQAATSGLLCMAIVGGAIVPLLSGRIADATTISGTFILPALAYGGIVIFAIAGRHIKAKHGVGIKPALPH